MRGIIHQEQPTRRRFVFICTANSLSRLLKLQQWRRRPAVDPEAEDKQRTISLWNVKYLLTQAGECICVSVTLTKMRWGKKRLSVCVLVVGLRGRLMLSCGNVW